MKIRIRLAVLAVLVSCFTSPTLFACTQPSNLGPAFPVWAPLANVKINLGGTPSSPVQAAATAWDNAILGFYGCGPFFILSGSTLTPTATINMTYGAITDPTLAGDDDSVGTSTTTTITRGVTDFIHATTSGGFISTISIQINSMMTASAAIQEVVAHELGHTLNLYDCNYPGCPVNSSVMEASHTLIAPGTTINSTIGQPGPTICDYSCLGCANNVNYTCAPPPPPPPPCHHIEVCDEGLAWNPIDCQCEAASPIILDIDGKGFNLTNAAAGVSFDISGAGHPIQMGWTAPGANNAFLCLPDSDGKCDDGKDLFGNFTPQPRTDNPNGFAALAVYDNPNKGGNGDGIIDSHDAIFSSLRLWIDENHDGISQPNEIYTLPSLGVNSISLHYKMGEKTDQYGNLFRYRAPVNPDRPDAVGRTAYDVFFVTLRSLSGTARNPMNPEVQKCAVPTVTKGGMLSTPGTLR